LENAYGLVADALQQMGIPASRSGRNDILVDGRKCSGYAKRLSRNRMMIHGTLMWDVDLETLTQVLAVPGSKLEAAGVASVRSRVANLKEYLPQVADIGAFRNALHAILAGNDGEISLTASQLDAVSRMADEKFRTWDWNYGRSPLTTFQNTVKFPCGTVTAHYSLKHGVFSELLFTGDFIGARPAAELAQQLIGHPVKDAADLDVSRYFDGLSSAEFMTLFEA
jgi:lipoate-protein ligase A